MDKLAQLAFNGSTQKKKKGLRVNFTTGLCNTVFTLDMTNFSTLAKLNEQQESEKEVNSSDVNRVK